MPVINIGSINCDHVYTVPDFVSPGETLACQSYQRYLGGKGMNQSIALLRAGVEVLHIGAVQQDDAWIRQAIAETGVAQTGVLFSEEPTGHAIIQVNARGQNCILLFPGANRALNAQHVEQLLTDHPQHGWVLLQNETNAVPELWALAKRLGKRVALNPAPCEPTLQQWPLHELDVLVVNEIEAQQLSGKSDVPEAMAALRQRCPKTLLLITLGADGLWAAQAEQEWRFPAQPTTVVDTTAAGDTITGYVLAGLDAGYSIEQTLQMALQAAAITVSRPGASSSIPWRKELVVNA